MTTYIPRLLNLNLPCDTCKYFNNRAVCVELGNCVKCENFGEDVCHCSELVPVEETTCPYYKKNEVEE